METLPEPEPAPPNHFFLSPEVIEIHLQNGTPIPEGTVRLIWVLNQLFKEGA